MAIYRKNCILFATFLVTLLLVIDQETGVTALPTFVCPNLEPSSPCHCSDGITRAPGEKLTKNGQKTTAALKTEIEEGYVSCTGQEVSQQDINRVVDSIRKVNNGSLVLRGFQVSSTNLPSLNLSPFLGGQFQNLEINYNPLLTEIMGPGVLPQVKIQAYSVEFVENNLNDAGILTILSYFEPRSVKYLNFANNKIQANFSNSFKAETCEDSDYEFIPWLSGYTSLRYLGLYGNLVQRVGSRQFIRNRNLHEIELDSNRLVQVCPNAFELDPYDDPDSYFISIYLRDNTNLTDSSFPSGLGQGSLSGTKRKADVDLDNCRFTTLSQDRFLDYLEENPSNSLTLEQNYIQCDSRLKWLKDRRTEFENRVSGLDCANDPGKTAFTSDLVDS